MHNSTRVLDLHSPVIHSSIYILKCTDVSAKNGDAISEGHRKFGIDSIKKESEKMESEFVVGVPGIHFSVCLGVLCVQPLTFN